MAKLFHPAVGRLRLTKTLASLLIAVLVTMLSAPLQAGASDRKRIADTFSILLSGKYRPVVHGPDLGLLQVDLSDGSFSRTKIFAISGLPKEDGGGGDHDRDRDKDKPIGKFYVQFAGMFAAYDLPGGAITMVFTGSDAKEVPDGQGGTYLVGTFDLNITEATGRYQSFVGGHNKMVDILHHLADGSFVEHCICIISRPA
jgi:hypothetical protein